MTDDTGMLQHAIFSVPNTREGYTTDDNARALIVSTRLMRAMDKRTSEVPQSLPPVPRFSLACIQWRCRTIQKLPQLRSQMARRDWLGRQPWPRPLGAGNCARPFAGCRDCAERQEDSSRPRFLQPDVHAAPAHGHSACLGMQAYLDWFPGDRAFKVFATRLPIACSTSMSAARTDTWHWFEKSLSYSNARLPQALILAGWRSNNKRMIAAGIESLQWLVAEQHRDRR